MLKTKLSSAECSIMPHKKVGATKLSSAECSIMPHKKVGATDKVVIG